jgi:hypothetical protein
MTLKTEDIGAAILKGVCNPEAKDLVVDLGEFELAALLDEDTLREVPIIKSIIACHKTWEAVHDRLFLRKVAMFLSSSPKFTHEQKEKFIQEHLHDLKEAKQLSDAIVLILDKLDDFEKPQMVAKAFAAFIRGEVGLETFRRLATAIGIGFLDDLKELARLDPAVSSVKEFFKLDPTVRSELRELYFKLLRTGLTRIKSSSGTVPITGVGYEVTELGKSFIKCMNA